MTLLQCIFIVDLLTHAYMRIIGFRFYRASAARCLNIVPPRPHAFIANKHSASKDINYWYYPHTSTTELPLVFLHGIGVGLYPYMEFLKEMNQGRTEAEGTIGIIAIEILSVSSRIKRAVMRKDQMCEQFRLILDHHGFDKFVLASHSYVYYLFAVKSNHQLTQSCPQIRFRNFNLLSKNARSCRKNYLRHPS